MTTIKPAKSDPVVPSFDGSVFEKFRMSSSERFHVTLIRTLEVKTHKKENRSLAITTDGGYSATVDHLDEESIPAINSLIAEIETARQQFTFD
jgi:hypothetical protein